MKQVKTIKKSKKWCRLLFVCVLLLFVIPMIITYFTHQYHFGTRVVHQNNYYEYLQDKYPSFTRDIVHFSSNEGQVLEGAFFYKEDLIEPHALLVWVHGMKVNYENYLAEIQYFTEKGYLVFTFNNTGVDTSEGESLKGLIQAPLDLQHALEYLYTIQELETIPQILIGHSWGGFSVATVSQLPLSRPVDGIVTLAGFWRNINVIEDIANYYVGDVIKLLVPFLTLYENYLFSENAHLNGIAGLENTTAPVLMIHSKDDVIVRYDNNFLYYYENFKENPRFTFSTYEEAGHKLTVHKESYNRIHDIMHHQMELSEHSDEYQKLEEERLTLIEDLNVDVMEEILDFCQLVIEIS